MGNLRTLLQLLFIGLLLIIIGTSRTNYVVTSNNLNIRNGVGVRPNGNLLFAISTKEANFYTFAKFFQDHGCKNALYLDGFVSRRYLPHQNWA